MLIVELSKKKIRAYRQSIGVSINALSKLAGISEAAIRQMDSDKWKPSSSTLVKLENIIPEDFSIPNINTSQVKIVKRRS